MSEDSHDTKKEPEVHEATEPKVHDTFDAAVTAKNVRKVVNILNRQFTDDPVGSSKCYNEIVKAMKASFVAYPKADFGFTLR